MSRSAESQPLPEFFFDRSLGKETAALLRAVGWTIHLIADVYPADAQDVHDGTWLTEGASRGWILLTKDKRIRYREAELGALQTGQLYCLSNGNLLVADMAARFAAAEPSIRRHAARGRTGFWIVYADGLARRRWP